MGIRPCNEVITVDNQNLNGFTITGNFSFVVGPDTPPLGVGSLELTAPVTMLLKDSSLTTSLTDLTAMGFSLYQTAGNCSFAFSLPIDTTGTGTVANDSLTLFGQVTSSGVWQTFDFLASPLLSNVDGSTTFDNYVTNHPNARLLMNNTTSILFSVVGSGCILNFDKLVIGISGFTTCYDFEPLPPG